MHLPRPCSPIEPQKLTKLSSDQSNSLSGYPDFEVESFDRADQLVLSLYLDWVWSAAVLVALCLDSASSPVGAGDLGVLSTGFFVGFWWNLELVS